MTYTIFTVTAEQIAALDAARAVELIAELLWAEGRRLGFPTTHVHVSTRITVPDGGIDASVDPDGTDLDRWVDSSRTQSTFAPANPPMTPATAASTPSSGRRERRSSRRNIQRPTNAPIATKTPKLVTSKSPIRNRTGYICARPLNGVLRR